MKPIHIVYSPEGKPDGLSKLKNYPTVVKILKHDDGEKSTNKRWHLLTNYGDTLRTLCSGEALDGSSSIVFNQKKGKVTCNECRSIIKFFKGVKL